MKFGIRVKRYSYKYIVNLLRRSLPSLFAVFFCALFVSISGWAIAYLVQHIVEQGGSPQPHKSVLIITLSVIGVIFCRLMLGVMRDAIQHKLNLKIQLSLGEKYINHVFNLPLSFFDNKHFTEGVGENFDADIIMESKGQITKHSYEIEIAAPFKSLRYAEGKNTVWRVNFYRETKRSKSYVDSWVKISRDKPGILSQFGTISGIKNIGGNKVVEIIPSSIISQSSRRVPQIDPIADLVNGSRLEHKRIMLHPSITARFQINPANKLNVAINPDFAQVEADQRVVTANQRFPVFFPEKRPFFSDDNEVFRTPLLPFNTRLLFLQNMP